MDYLTLTKPEITLMVMATATAGFWAGHTGELNLSQWLHTLAGVGLACGGTAALNMLIERQDDARMRRTRVRPIPAGRITPGHALWFGLATFALGCLWLAVKVNLLSAGLTILTTGLYLFAYSPLKHRTEHCLLVGAIPGALPPVIGWAASAGTVGWGAGVLFLIQFLWQIPHFISIAWLNREDYANVGWRMLPAPDPDGRRTALRICVYGSLLIAASLLPAYFDTTGKLYLIGAVTLGFLFFLLNFRFAFDRSTQAARWVFTASMIYLPALLLLFALDQRSL